MTQREDRAGRILGCLLAGAVGDALGADIEFLSTEAIRDQFGEDGVNGYIGEQGRITDDTQMTLFTIDGLLRAWGPNNELRNHTDHFLDAYLRWLHTQGRSVETIGWRNQEFEPSGWLVVERSLHVSRAPGNTCLGALNASFGGRPAPVEDSKGCGGVMRVAPLAWAPGDVFQLACDAAGITHGHPTGRLASGALALLIREIDIALDASASHPTMQHGAQSVARPQSAGALLRDALDVVLNRLANEDESDETVEALQAAVNLADRTPRATPEAVESLGGGWIAEEALAISVYCALTARDMRSGLLAAVNHSGDSDSTGAITGNILGATLGARAIPIELLVSLTEGWLVEAAARDLALTVEGAEPDRLRYPIPG